MVSIYNKCNAYAVTVFCSILLHDVVNSHVLFQQNFFEYIHNSTDRHCCICICTHLAYIFVYICIFAYVNTYGNISLNTHTSTHSNNVHSQYEKKTMCHLEAKVIKRLEFIYYICPFTFETLYNIYIYLIINLKKMSKCE